MLGFVFVFSPHALTHGTSLGTHPTWHALAFSLPLAMLAFTGLETVANLAEEARRPGVDLPRSVFGGIATVVTVYVAIAVVAVSAFPGPNTELGTRWIRAPLLGDRRPASTSELPWPLGDVLRVLRRRHRRADPARRGHDVDLRLLAPRLLARRARPAAASVRPAQPPRARLAARDPRGRADRRSAIVIATSFIKHDVAFLASLFSFGVLLAFTAAQLAVIKLRIAEPDLTRPYRAPFNVRIRGAPSPAAGDRRLDRHVRDLDHRDGDAPGRALRRPGLARGRRSSSSSPCAARTARG